MYIGAQRWVPSKRIAEPHAPFRIPELSLFYIVSLDEVYEGAVYYPSPAYCRKQSPSEPQNPLHLGSAGSRREFLRLIE